MGKRRSWAMGRHWNWVWRTWYVATRDIHSYIFQCTVLFACSVIRYVIAGSCIAANAQILSGVVCNPVICIIFCLTKCNFTIGKVLEFNVAFINGSIQDKCAQIRDYAIRCICDKTLDKVSGCEDENERKLSKGKSTATRITINIKQTLACWKIRLYIVLSLK